MQAEELEQFFHAVRPATWARWDLEARIAASPSVKATDRHRRRVPRRPHRTWSAAPTSSTTTCATSTPGRDFTWTLARRHSQRERGRGLPEGELRGKLVVGKAVEVGHIFKLGYKYSESMGARVLDPNGKEVTPIMGSYGIGIERILTAAIEQSNDANGFWLPASIAPFTVVVTITNVADAALRATGEKLAADLEAAGLDVLLDDRDERAGVKFKDADLVGIPYRINVGKKAAAGQVELVTRATGTSVDVALTEVVAMVKKRVQEEQLLKRVLACFEPVACALAGRRPVPQIQELEARG